MLKRNAGLLAAGAAIIALNASAAAAQTKPTSTKRIPIAKEAPGEAAMAKTDTVTVTVYRTDTLRLRGRVDTVRTTTTVMRTDTVMQAAPMMVSRRVGGLYIGIGGGVELPYGSIRTVNQPGEVGQLNLGWQGADSWLGVRLDGTYGRYARNPDYGSLNLASTTSVDRPMIFTGNADLRLDLPFFNSVLGSSVKFKPYILGGGSMIRYSDLRIKTQPGGSLYASGFSGQHAVFASDANNLQSDGSYHSDYGWNIGGGLAFHAGKKEVFIESRAIAFQHGANADFKTAWQVPIVFGVNFY